jgi:hypothetical protein
MADDKKLSSDDWVAKSDQMAGKAEHLVNQSWDDPLQMMRAQTFVALASLYLQRASYERDRG